MNRYAYFRGHLRQVRPCWAWLFRLLHIGVELPPQADALRDVLATMAAYHRACEIYLRA